MTRRALLGASAMAGVGLAGWVLGFAGFDDITVETGVLTTPRRPGRQARWRLATPPAPEAVIVGLHGKGGSSAQWFDLLRVPALIAGTGLAFAAIDGGNSYWHQRADGSDSGAMIVLDFLPLLQARGMPVHRLGLAGISMGGYGALLLASSLTVKRVFGVATMSAALWTAPTAMRPGSFDSPEDFARNDVFARTAVLDRIPMHLACGTEDPFIRGNREFSRRVAEIETDFSRGGHDTAYWAANVGNLITWLAWHA